MTENLVSSDDVTKAQYGARLVKLKKLLEALVHANQEKSRDDFAYANSLETSTSRDFAGFFSAATMKEVADSCFMQLFKLAADGADPVSAFNLFERYVAENVYRRAIEQEHGRAPTEAQRRELGAYARVLKMVHEA